MRRGSFILLLTAFGACAPAEPPAPRVVRSGAYTTTLAPGGWRETVAQDANQNGTPEVVIHLDREGRIVRAEMDADDDGKVDRWEWHRPDGSIESVANSLRRTGRADEWMFPDAKGNLTKRGLDQDDDGKPDLWQFYENGQLVREEPSR